MTKETRIVFSLEDLVSVRFQCSKCQGELVQRFDGRHWRLPTSCPLCLARWDERDSRRPELDELLLMMRNGWPIDQTRILVSGSSWTALLWRRRANRNGECLE